MKKQLSPAVVWGLLTVVVLVVVVVGYKMLAGGGYKASTIADKAKMDAVTTGKEQMYTPPKDVPGIVIPGREGAAPAPGGGGAGGYNLTPPKF